MTQFHLANAHITTLQHQHAPNFISPVIRQKITQFEVCEGHYVSGCFENLVDKMIFN